MFNRHVLFDDADTMLEELMRGPVSKALEIPEHVVWGSQSDATFETLAEDFMWPVVDIGES